MPDISIVTLNTWKGDGDYRRRMVATVDLLAGLEPDIVLLQEAFAVPSRRISTAKTLSSALGLHCAYHPAREKTRSFEGQDVLSQSGLAVLARNQILSSRAVTLPADARDGERIAQIAEIVGAGGTDGAPTVTILNLHLTHLEDRSELRRRQCVTALSALPEDVDGPIVAGGDFNDIVDAAWLSPVADAVPGLTLRNTRAGAPDGWEAPTLVEPPPDGRPACIDHLLAVSRAGGAAIEVGGVSHHGGAEVSDHRAVRVVVQAGGRTDQVFG